MCSVFFLILAGLTTLLVTAGTVPANSPALGTGFENSNILDGCKSHHLYSRAQLHAIFFHFLVILIVSLLDYTLLQGRNQEVQNISYCREQTKLIWHQKAKFEFKHSKIIPIPPGVSQIMSLLIHMVYLLS